MKQTLSERLQDGQNRHIWTTDMQRAADALDLAEKTLEADVSVMQAITECSEDHVWVKQAAKKQRKRAVIALKAIKGVK